MADAILEEISDGCDINRYEAEIAARVAMAAMKYEDGTDETALVAAANQERLDPVSLAGAWDRMIDEALRE